MKTRVLTGSSVRQKPEILARYLESLGDLASETVVIDYIFVDDNVDEESSRLLRTFKRDGSAVTILEGGDLPETDYVCTEETHHWRRSLVHKIAAYKNQIIRHALSHGYDSMFFVDSDLILHPLLLERLKETKKDIVSEIFWTRWNLSHRALPNVWLFDNYDMVPREFTEEVNASEQEKRRAAFLAMLKEPGVYEVGGLGAVTLISRAALKAGVDYRTIKNLSFFGEDRHFCVRAAVLGFGLYVDTTYPAYHIYRESDLAGVKAYMQQNRLEDVKTAPGPRSSQPADCTPST